jgi:hypothetical protein
MKRILTAAALAPLSMAFWLHAGSALAQQRPPSRSFAPQSQLQQRLPSRSFAPQSQPQQDEAPPDSDLPTDDDDAGNEAANTAPISRQAQDLWNPGRSVAPAGR